MVAVLIDPDKCTPLSIKKIAENPAFQGVDFLLVGGSLVTDGDMKSCLEIIKAQTDKKCIIFPGGPNQIDAAADALLLLSLISGRNPDLLIGKHVESAFKLKQSKLEIISTGYILIDGGRTTTVSYISNTIPIPSDKIEIAASTALAGNLLGNQIIYLDCGSGADKHAPSKLIQAVKSEINVPLVVGGGIRTKDEAEAVFSGGADVVVVGNKIEEDSSFLSDLIEAKNKFNPLSVQIQ